MRQIKVKIVDKKTLELLEDGLKGDQISLNEIESCDLSLINNMIDDTFNERVEEIKEKAKTDSYKLARLEVTKEFNDKLSKLEKDKSTLETELKSQEKVLQAKYQKEQQDKIDDLKSQRDTLEERLKNLKDNEKDRVKNMVLESSKELSDEIARLKSEIQSMGKAEETKRELEVLKAVNEQKEKDKEDIASLTNELAMLKSERASLNIKKLGESLEIWCDNEFKSYQLSGFEDTTWSKDNDAIADLDSTKTKADFIFKVYSGSDHSTELTSVCLEMKSETLVSANHKKNSDHYAKLDRDRKKKGCVYALLVSELEWDPQNDVPIVRVPEYENMYRVRPAYFISFLSLVYALSKKYQELITEKAKEAIRFKDSDSILADFESFKNDLLDKQLARLEKRVTEILKQSEIITKASDKIKVEANSIIDTDLQQIKNKIDKFSIKRLTKKINNLEEKSDEGE